MMTLKEKQQIMDEAVKAEILMLALKEIASIDLDSNIESHFILQDVVSIAKKAIERYT